MENFKKHFVAFLLSGWALIHPVISFSQSERAYHKSMLTGDETVSRAKPVTDLRLYGGVVFDLMSSLGEVKNTYFYGKSRLVIHDKILLDGSAFYNPGGVSSIQRYQPVTYYNAHLTIGKNMGLTAGIESGNRYYTTQKDSNQANASYYNFVNTDTDKEKYFKSAQINQSMTAYCFGFSFMSMERQQSFWREKGNPLKIIDMTIEAMYAPKISYDKQLQFSPFGLWATQTYSMNELNIRHWGFRLVAECGGTAKLSFHQEIGIRPGISPVAAHTKGEMKSRVYISMGVSICLDADPSHLQARKENKNKPFLTD